MSITCPNAGCASAQQRLEPGAVGIGNLFEAYAKAEARQMIDDLSLHRDRVAVWRGQLQSQHFSNRSLAVSINKASAFADVGRTRVSFAGGAFPNSFHHEREASVLSFVINHSVTDVVSRRGIILSLAFAD